MKKTFHISISCKRRRHLQQINYATLNQTIEVSVISKLLKFYIYVKVRRDTGAAVKIYITGDTKAIVI